MYPRHGSCPSSHPLLRSEDSGNWRELWEQSKALEAVMKSCAQPKGQGQSLRAMDTRWDTQWVSGYLQVGADSPQDIIDTVTRDEGHEDVLQEKEMSCWERFPPS